MAEVTESMNLLLRDQVTCPVCLDVYKQPKSLVCQHALCVECIEGLPVSREEGEYVIHCPVCRDKTILQGEGTANLRTAFQTNAMIELYEKARQNSAKAKQTSIESETGEYPKCDKHHRDMDMFCEKCQQVICAVCGAREHGNHKFDLITDLFPRHQKEITGHLDKVRQQIDDILDNLDVLYSTENDIVQQGEHAKTEIDSLVQKLTRIINKSGDQLKESVEEMVQHKVQLISTQRDKLEKTLHQLKTCEDRVAKELQDCLQHQILTEKSNLIESMKSACQAVSVEQPPNKDGYIVTPSEGIIDQCGNISVISKVALPSTSDKALPSVGIAECRGKGSEVAMVGTKRTFTLHLPTVPDSTISCYLYNQDGGPIVQCTVQASHKEQNQSHKAVFTSPSSKTKFWRPQKSTQRSATQKELHIPCPQYTLSYTPTHTGRHHIKLQVDGVDTPCTPPTINVLPSRQKQTEIIKGFYSPFAMAAKPGLGLVVSEKNNHTIAVCVDGQVVERFGGWGSELGHLKSPTGVALTTDDHIIVVDTDNNRVQKFTMKGKLVACAGTSGNGKLQFNGPHDVAVSSKGAIYVSDTYNHRIQVLHAGLTFSHTFSSLGSEPGKLNHPYGIAIDTQDIVYVCDSYNSRIQKFSPSGDMLGIFKKDLDPYYVAIDAHNIVYVTDTTSKQVLVFDSVGGYLGSAGSTGIEPIRVAMDSAGNLYVSNRNNITIF